MKQNVGKRLEISQLKWWRRAQTCGDLEAWATLQQGLEETLLSWFHGHPYREAASRLYSERHFVTLAFERLRQAVLQRQVACETLSEVLLYLRACLNGAILETVRASSAPAAPTCFWPDEQDSPNMSEVWDRLQALLSNESERRLAYLLYYCGLSPTQIVQYCALEWSDVHEVARLRRSIFARLMHRPEL